MLFYALPCLFLGIIVDTKETRNTIASYTSIFGAKTQDRRKKILFILDFSNNSNRTLVWESLCLGMEELHESLGETKNYYGGAYCCFRQHY
jgi:KaiC/GvpD/RAD55 family RecA-like ATPase